MVDTNIFIDLLNKGLALLGTYKAVSEYGPKFLKSAKNLTKRTFYDIEEIFPKLCEHELALGDIIECSGFLSKYSQTFLPMSFLPSVPGQSTEKILKMSYQNGKITNHCRLSTTWEAIQVPVNILPTLNNLRLCFLYGEDFKTFIHPVNDGKDNPELKNTIMVPKNAKPIPVLIDISKHSPYIDKFVDLKARITVIPDELTKALKMLNNNVLLNHNENFYNPYAEIGSFICLSVIENDPDIKVEKVNSNIPNAEAQVFAELHVEDLNLYPNVAKAIIEDSIPDLASPALKVMTVHGYEAIPYLTKGNIRIIYKEPNIVGLYTKVKLFDHISYLETISAMRKYNQQLSRKIQNRSLEVIGKRLYTKTDFVFDPTKAPLFDTRGVLNLNPDDYPGLGNIKDIKETIDWYRSAK